MSSSTSSSDRPDRRAPAPRSGRWKVPVALLVFFAALEIFTRTRLFDSSKDFRRFAGYGERARNLVASDGVRLALIGNSATDRGVDLPTVRDTLGQAGVKATPELIVADQSRINTWHYMLQKYFFRPGLRPDAVVVTFYEDDLRDGNAVEIGRLAQFFTSVRDWPDVFALDLPDWGRRFEFVLASGWATFAASERIRERALEALIPDFREYAEVTNTAIFEHNRLRHPAHAVEAPRSYQALRRLLRAAAEADVRLIFVAYPTRTDTGRAPYDVPADTLQILREAGVSFIDLRHTPGLDAAGQYDDEVHLSAAGRTPYSRALAQALAPLLSGNPRAR